MCFLCEKQVTMVLSVIDDKTASIHLQTRKLQFDLSWELGKDIHALIFGVIDVLCSTTHEGAKWVFLYEGLRGPGVGSISPVGLTVA